MVYRRNERCCSARFSDLQAVITFTLGLQAAEAGELKLAFEAFSEGIRLARATHNTNLFYLSAGHLAMIQVAGGDLHGAFQTYNQALAEAKELRQMVSPYVALLHAGIGSSVV